MSDEELMLKYKFGSEEAFGQIYEKYSPKVYGFTRKRLRVSEVEDFYQKVWRQLHEKRHLFSDQPFAPWFYTLMKNLLIDEYRSLGKKRPEQNDHLLKSLYTEEQVSEVDIEDMLSQLPVETATLVKKYYLEDVSYEELEIETGMSQSNLRQRLSRALRGLRSKLKGQEL